MTSLTDSMLRGVAPFSHLETVDSDVTSRMAASR